MNTSNASNQLSTKESYSFSHLFIDLKRHLSPHRIHFGIGTALAVFSSAIWLAIPWAFGEIITFSSEYETGVSTEPVWQYLALIAIVSLLYYCAQEVGRFLIYLVGNKISVDLQKQTLRHMIRLNLNWHETENSGNKLKKISRGGDSLRELLQLYINLFIDTVVSLIGIGVIFSIMDWRLILILLAFFGIQYVLGVFLTGRARSQARKVNTQEEEFEGMKFELLNNIRTIKTLDMLHPIIDMVGNKTQSLVSEIRQRIILFRTRMAVLGVNQQIFRLLIIGFAAWKVIDGDFEVGVIAHVYFYFGKVESSAKRFSDMYHKLVLIRINLEGSFGILREKASIEEEGTLDFPSDWQQLTLNKLKFSYANRDVLHGIDLSIERGQKIGIVGASGAGKSTLFQLLQKLYQQYEGQIAFDTYDLRDIRRETYTSHMGVILQETELFNLSIKDNLTLGQDLDEAGKAWLEEVLFIAGLKAWIDKLPKGWHTVVGEKGVKLSGGEKQRLGIARALYRNPQLLFLDEATSQLDAELEFHIQARLKEFAKEMTVLVVAHRLASLQHMDHIIVLEKGKIIESGSFEDLLDQKGLFYSLWEKQNLEANGLPS
ncbi:MAG: ABC transporter ATP-binding protein [Bacteroidota bacterium]